MVVVGGLGSGHGVDGRCVDEGAWIGQGEGNDAEFGSWLFGFGSEVGWEPWFCVH